MCLSGCVSRVDELYAFFIQWSPNIEADKEGFVVVNQNISAHMSEASLSEPRLLRTASFSKDWEVRTSTEGYCKTARTGRSADDLIHKNRPRYDL